jgi:hypothetical protein
MNKRLKMVLITASGVVVLGIIVALVYFFSFLSSSRQNAEIPLKITPLSPLTSSTIIPGLTTENVISFLVNNNLVCNQKQETYKKIYYRISCEQVTPDYALTVHIFSSNQKDVNLIDANFTQRNNPSDDQAINFLEIITQLPMDGVQTDQIKDWINTSMPDLDKQPDLIKETTINHLFIRIYGKPNDRSLEIGKID